MYFRLKFFFIPLSFGVESGSPATMRFAKLIIFQFVRKVILHIKKRGLKKRAAKQNSAVI